MNSRPRRATTVRPHLRLGRPVSGHPRAGSDGSGSDSRSYDPLQRALVQLEFPYRLIYRTRCFISIGGKPPCGKLVYFFRDEHGGCALFDKPGYPWPPHECWQYREPELRRQIATELKQRHFEGRWYTLGGCPFRPAKGDSDFRGVVFVSRGATLQPREVQIKAHRRSRTIELVEKRCGIVVPHGHRERYIDVTIPLEREELFSPYTLHEVVAKRVKHGARWRWIVVAHREAYPGRKPSGRLANILGIQSRCYYCCDSITNRWGFDDKGREECLTCARRRLDSGAADFETWISRINRKPR